ncbi:unnamed protein product [Vitrella brassicaformis CCMP3155]|uniref:Uncharacterized protein n=1 Tax=Vitrella brassicaformis (strain CCMP3155) TaxID=1169540 RepID=A0A0G4EGQ2_VITBC|nr:unnamed protein product [Vitrella brassicaformis CCMP3155]|eukprot:CEL94648.1 unnamed protein product [Vitrella brassicaformis CCMP3155]
MKLGETPGPPRPRTGKFWDPIHESARSLDPWQWPSKCLDQVPALVWLVVILLLFPGASKAVPTPGKVAVVSTLRRCGLVVTELNNRFAGTGPVSHTQTLTKAWRLLTPFCPVFLRAEQFLLVLSFQQPVEVASRRRQDRRNRPPQAAQVAAGFDRCVDRSEARPREGGREAAHLAAHT